MKKKYKLLIMYSLIIVFAYIVGFSYTGYHEIIHQGIFTRFNVSSYISINRLTLSGQTVPENDNCLKINECELENRINDIVGYNSALIIFTMFFILAIYIFYKVILENDKAVCNM